MMSRLRPLRKINLAPMLALGLAAGLLAACSSTQITDMIPTAAGGLPENAPARPAAAPEYPAVNAMPQRREALPLTDDEVKRTQAEMTTLRQQQEQRAAEAGTEPAAAPALESRLPSRARGLPDKGPCAVPCVIPSPQCTTADGDARRRCAVYTG